MQFLRQDGTYLQRALELAQAAAAFASPNPTVGCVLVRDGLFLAEGAHHYEYRDHAEIAALRALAAAGGSAQGATAYVTLEPCSHHGRTGPCADALVAAGITRCVVATLDPNPEVCGRGVAKLLAAGVEVVVVPSALPEAQQARRLNDAFAFAIQFGRPFVALKAAVSQDGMLAPAPHTRVTTGPVWLTGAAARRDVQARRHVADAMLTGIGTVLADDPALTDRTGEPRRRPLLRAVLDSDLRTPLDAQLVRVSGELTVLFCSAEASASRAAALRARDVEIVRLPFTADGLDLGGVLQHLYERHAVRSVLVEAGAVVNGALLRADLVDFVALYEAPVQLGAEGVPFAHGGPEAAALELRLQQPEQRSFPHGDGEDVLVTGYLHDPWAGMPGGRDVRGAGA